MGTRCQGFLISYDLSGRRINAKVETTTQRGDIEDLMRSHGFIVHDLGVDVPPERFGEELQKTGAPVLALSALITPAFVIMKEAISLLEEKGLRENTFVIIGGGVTTNFARKELSADAQTLDPTDAIRLC